MKLKELDQDVVRRLDRAFLTGDAPVDVEDLLEEFPGREVDLNEVTVVVTEAMERFQDERTMSDAWLGPRLHAALRLSRREASRRGLWRYLGVVALSDYVRWRWSRLEEDVVVPPTLDRFVGPDYKQALARLWWMAELFRDGDDYAPAASALENQDVTNTLFRMDIAHHRPTALGAIRALAEAGTGDNSGSGREANALAKAVNSAATTLAIDLVAPDTPLDDAARERWMEDAGAYDAAEFFDDLPEGPDDPPVPTESLETMTKLLGQLLEEAPVRGRA